MVDKEEKIRKYIKVYKEDWQVIKKMSINEEKPAAAVLHSLIIEYILEHPEEFSSQVIEKAKLDRLEYP